jgi:putative aldouronate transport system substrate-binding protein
MKKLILGIMLVSFTALCFSGGKNESSSGQTGAMPARITVEVFDRGTDGGKTDPTNNKWTEWIKEKLLKDENIIVEFVPVPRASETQTLINLMAAGSPPDIAYTYSSADITSWSEQGGLFDMASYIDTTLKDLKAFLGPDKALLGRDMIRRAQNNTTGQVFSIPARRMNVAFKNVFIRKDWLDKLGLPLPKTKQEFYDALVAFKEKDPGGVGKDKVIPFTLTDAHWDTGMIVDSFIDPSLSDKERWINTVAERNFLLPGYKEGIRFVNKMYNAGLVDRDFPLYGQTTGMADLIKSGVVGSVIQNWDQIFREGNALLTDLRKNVPDAMLVPVDCMESSDGITHKSAYDAAGILFFIPKSCKDPDAAMRYLNWLSKYENYHFIQTGPEGIVHTMVNGVPKLNPSAPDGWIQNSPQNIDYTIMLNGLFLETEEKSIQAIAAGYPWPADMVSNAYDIAMTNARPGLVVVTKTPLTVAGPLNQTLVDKGSVILVESITAPVNRFDAVYDAGVADWRASGADAVVAERRAKYPN